MIALAAMCLVAAVAALTVTVLGRQLRADRREAANREREWARERRDLVNRVMHLADKTWEPPDLPSSIPPESAEAYEIMFPEEQPLY